MRSIEPFGGRIAERPCPCQRVFNIKNMILRKTKKCWICKKRKDVSKFYKSKRNNDGFQCQCKPCHNDYNKKYNEKYNEKNRLKISERSRSAKRWLKSDQKEKARIRSSEWRNKNPREFERKRYAYYCVRKALLCGKLKKLACIKCGSDKSIAHHENYDKPLKVIWLCYMHHKHRHVEISKLK